MVIESLAGLGIERDHLAGLELAARDDRRGIDAEHARLAADVEPAALVRAPADRPQTHAIDSADEHPAIRRDQPRWSIPGAQAPVCAPTVAKEVNRFLAPELGFRVPHRRNAQTQGAQEAPAAL